LRLARLDGTFQRNSWEETMAFIGPLEDRILIRELYGRYADASWRGDREEWIGCFTHEGRWITHLFDCTGPDALREQWDSLWADWAEVAFLGDIGAIEVDGDAATCRSYAREVVLTKAGTIFKLAGSYEDSLRRDNGAWLFSRRLYRPMIQEF
jgi:hypothetical protein